MGENIYLTHHQRIWFISVLVS